MATRPRWRGLLLVPALFFVQTGPALSGSDSVRLGIGVTVEPIVIVAVADTVARNPGELRIRVPVSEHGVSTVPIELSGNARVSVAARPDNVIGIDTGQVGAAMPAPTSAAPANRAPVGYKLSLSFPPARTNRSLARPEGAPEAAVDPVTLDLSQMGNIITGTLAVTTRRLWTEDGSPAVADVYVATIDIKIEIRD